MNQGLPIFSPFQKPRRFRQFQVSTAGAFRSIGWSPDGKELYYSNAAARIMAVDVTTNGGEFIAGTPHPLNIGVVTVHGSRNNFDLARDGRILLFSNQNSTAGGHTPIVVVLNWKSGLKQ